MSTKIYMSNVITCKFSDRSCFKLGSVHPSFHLGKNLHYYQASWDVSVCTTESHEKCFLSLFRLIQINFRVGNSPEEIRLYHIILKKLNTNKKRKGQPPKGHCQAETSALQYTPHLTQLEKEGDEGMMGKREVKIPGGGFPGIVELLKE